MENTSNARKAYNIGIAICTIALLSFALFLAIEPASAQFGLDAAAPAALKSQSSIPTIIGRIISAVIGLIGVVFLILMLYAGLMWMTARGNAERAEKAKDTIARAVIGLIIVASAYAITSFVITRVGASTGSSSGTTEQSSSGGSCSSGASCGSDSDCGGRSVGQCEEISGKCECF